MARVVFLPATTDVSAGTHRPPLTFVALADEFQAVCKRGLDDVVSSRGEDAAEDEVRAVGHAREDDVRQEREDDLGDDVHGQHIERIGA